jgi:hypothetical protein
MKKLIKNYTTSVPVQKTIAEIQQLLAENGASGIAQDYENGIITAVFFRIQLGDKQLAFRLPVKTQDVYTALFKGKGQEWKYKDQRMAQASQVAWRICKTWLEAQITLVNLQQAKLEEVFLPYLLVGAKQTLFEKMQNNQFLLPE